MTVVEGPKDSDIGWSQYRGKWCQFPKWTAINKIVFCMLDFPIQILSIDTLVQEAIQAFHDNEKITEALPIQKEPEEKASLVLQEKAKESQASMIWVFFSTPCLLEIWSCMESKRSSRPEVSKLFHTGPESKYFRFYRPRGKIKDVMLVLI